MSVTQPVQPHFTKLDAAVFVVLLSALAYVCGFVFEAQYLTYFGVSTEFAQIQLKSAMSCGIVIFAVLLVMMLILQAFAPLLSGLSIRVQNRFFTVVSSVLFIAFLLWALDMRWYIAMPLFAIALGGFAYHFIAPAFRRSITGRTWAEKVETHWQKFSANLQADAISSLLVQRLGSQLTGILAAGLVSIVLASAGGSAMAALERQFYFPVAENSCIVLRVREENLLCAGIKDKARTMTGTVFLINATGVELRKREVGRIQRSGPNSEVVSFLGIEILGPNRLFN